MTRHGSIFLEVDGPAVEPKTVDAPKFLELAAAFYGALQKAASVTELELDLHGIDVVDKCIQLGVSTSREFQARQCAHLVSALVAGRVPPIPGMGGVTTRLRDARRAFPGGYTVVTRVGDWSGRLDAPAAPQQQRQETVENLRALVVNVGGKDPKVRLTSRSLEKPFSLSIARETAPSLGALLYREIDLVAEAVRDGEGHILEGRLLSFDEVQDRNAIDEWRRWYRQGYDEWDDVEDIEAELGRGQRE